MSKNLFHHAFLSGWILINFCIFQKPWYKNFRGAVESLGDSRYIFYGEIAILDDDKVEITELPIMKWTQDYKEHVLEPMLNPPGEKATPLIT